MKKLLIGLNLVLSISSYGMTIEEVKENIPKDFYHDNIVINMDGSVTISNITVSSGNKIYKVGADKRIGYRHDSFKGLCKALGFEKNNLRDNESTLFHNPNGTGLAEKAIHYRKDGSQTIWDFSEYISQVTCYNGEKPNPVILINGDVYESFNSEQ